MSARDYYEVLGVGRDVSVDEIKKAYRKLALEHHPDRNPGDASAEEKFKEATEAYEVLKDTEKRARYDQYGHAGVGAGASGGGFEHGFDLSDALRAFMEDFGFGGGFGLDDMFGGGGARGRGRARSRGRDRQIQLSLTLEEIAKGVKKKIRVQKEVSCSTCGGRGAKNESDVVDCADCRGTGQIKQVFRTILGQTVNVTVCPSCQGRGRSVKNPCRDCAGTGTVRGTETVEVRVPAGVMAGNFMRIEGGGDAGPRGAPPGDLVVVFDEKPHEVYLRSGPDLVSEVHITVSQAALGMKVDVPTLSGSARIKIPEGIQGGKVLRLRGKGLPELRGGARGDLLVRVIVDTPRNLSRTDKEILESLARSRDDAAPVFARPRDIEQADARA